LASAQIESVCSRFSRSAPPIQHVPFEKRPISQMSENTPWSFKTKQWEPSRFF